MFAVTIPLVLHAQSPELIGLGYGAESGLSNTDARLVVIRIIQFVLGLLGIVTTVLMLYAGFTWMTSAGNDEKITQAKKTITAAVFGLILVFLSFAITSFVLRNIYHATSGNIYSSYSTTF